MEIGHRVFGRQGERVATTIASLVFGAESLDVVEWLCLVTHEVDQESQGVRLRKMGLAWVELVVKLGVHVGGEVVVSVLA